MRGTGQAGGGFLALSPLLMPHAGAFPVHPRHPAGRSLGAMIFEKRFDSSGVLTKWLELKVDAIQTLSYTISQRGEIGDTARIGTTYFVRDVILARQSYPSGITPIVDPS